MFFMFFYSSLMSICNPMGYDRPKVSVVFRAGKFEYRENRVRGAEKDVGARCWRKYLIS